jgi:DNA repair protein RAD50
MSSLTRLALMGIRSFGPDREESIEFYRPLTIITGANGTGKRYISYVKPWI